MLLQAKEIVLEEQGTMSLVGERTAQPKTSDRGVALLKFTLELLKSHPEGMRPQDIFREIEAKLRLNSFDTEPMKGSGLPRWRAALHFFSVAASKAGFLVKSDGRWTVTDQGQKAASLSVEDLKRQVRARYREWRWGGRKTAPEPADIATGVDEQATSESASVLFDDSKERARAEIDAYLDTLSAYDFQDLVGALLEGMGYTTRFVAPPGPDGGTDALAYVDPLGARTPHIRVQVKHRDQAAGREEIAALRGITATGLIPDLDHYKGSFGGCAFPLWRDRAATQPNIKPALLAHLAKVFAQPVKAEDVMAYLAAVMAHPAFTARFKADLVRPGLRVPLTADAKLFAEAVALGSEVIWLHTYGERFVDPAAGRPKGPPRLPKETAPSIPAKGAIPGAPEPLPDTMDYDPAARRLKIGKGFVENVTPQMWTYEVSGKQVLWHWFSYRRRDRTRPIIGDRRSPSPLDKIQPDHWLPEYTTDLLDLLNVLGRLIALEPKQADLLERICAGKLRKVDELREAGALTHAGGEAVQKGKKKSKG